MHLYQIFNMPFKISATVDDPKLKIANKDASFSYKIIDNDNYIIDKEGNVKAIPGYSPKIGEKFTVEVSYKCENGKISKKTKTFTVK